MTFVVVIVMMIYSTIKLIHLFDKHNPNISQLSQKNVFDNKEKLNINEIDFKFAFSVESYLHRNILDDPKFVKYIVRVIGKKDGKEYEQIVPFHKCTESDWANFPPPSKASKDVWT